MKKRFLLILMTLLSVTVGVMADGITGVTLTLRHNGKSSFDYQVPATGATDIDLTAEKTTSLIIQKVVVETSGSVSDVSFSVPTGAGISTVNAPSASRARYTLSGQRVGKSYSGLVIENGKKLLLRR